MSSRPSRTRPYKDFLTPAMHRQFSKALATLLICCYAEALAIGRWNSWLWSWFPLGVVGLRTSCLFFSVVGILILRIARLHVGWRTSSSTFSTFLQHGLKVQNLLLLGAYVFSAWLFNETYLLSVSESADLKRIKTTQNNSRTVLNEKPIFLASYLYFLAMIQTCIHLYYDYDRIKMPITKTKPISSSDQRPHLVIPANDQLNSKALDLARRAVYRVLVAEVAFIMLYICELPIIPGFWSISIRQILWRCNRSFAVLIWNLPKSTVPPTTAPFHWRVLLAMLTAGFLLIMLWEVGNAALTAYVAQEPLKNERPITYESRDPNGSLLTGLAAKKLHTRVFAFWELVYIAQRFEGRRRAIYEDIEREGGTAWSQIRSICMSTINGVTLRIQEFERPSASTMVVDATQKDELPRLLQPLQDSPGGLFMESQQPTSKRGYAVEAVASFAKANGQSASPDWGVRDYLAPIIAQTVTQFRDQATWFLRIPLGIPFRQEYRRRIAAVVLGTPYGEVSIIVDAIDALTRFAVCSLKEDKYGNVQRDIRSIVQTFTNTILALERLKGTFNFHWTDVDQVKDCPETDVLLAAMRGGLQEILDAFSEYYEVLRLTKSELRIAKEAATPPVEGRPVEMVKQGNKEMLRG